MTSDLHRRRMDVVGFGHEILYQKMVLYLNTYFEINYKWSFLFGNISMLLENLFRWSCKLFPTLEGSYISNVLDGILRQLTTVQKGKKSDSERVRFPKIRLFANSQSSFVELAML